MENYEVMFLLDVNRPEDERRDIANDVEKDVIDLGGEVEETSQYDVRDLAFPIEGVNRADYRLIEYEAEKAGSTNDELRERLNFRDDVVRYLIINQNKDRQPSEDVFKSEEEAEAESRRSEAESDTEETVEASDESETEEAETTEVS